MQMENEQKEQTLLVTHPALFHGDPVKFVVVAALIPFGIGIVLLFVMWLQCRFTIFTITDLRTLSQSGILNRNTNEVRHKDVRNLQVNQDLFQRYFGFGSVAISSAGQSDIELTLLAIQNPSKVADLIRQYQI